jgi:hypothetical protein
MDVSLLQIGLAIVSAFFVFTGYMIVYENPLESDAKIKAVAETIESIVYEVDSFWIEDRRTYVFPTIMDNILLQISPEYIKLSDEKNKQHTLLIPVPQHIWIVDEHVNLDSASSWHQEIYNQTGHYGSRNDPCSDEFSVQTWIDTQWTEYQDQFFRNPYVCTNTVLNIEKCIIFKEQHINEELCIVPEVEFIILQDG